MGKFSSSEKSNNCNTIITLLVLFVVLFSNAFEKLYPIINPLGDYSNMFIERTELATYITSIIFLMVVNRFRRDNTFLVWFSNLFIFIVLYIICFSSKSDTILDFPIFSKNINSYINLSLFFSLGIISLSILRIKISISNIFLSSIIWASCAKLDWWEEGNLANILLTQSNSFKTSIITIVLSIIVSYIWLSPDFLDRKKTKANLTVSILLTTTFIIIAGLVFYTKLTTSGEIGSARFYVNWTFYLGPIKSLRDCCYLLFNNPSQYGFLNILIPSILPLPITMAFKISLFTMVIFYLSIIFYLVVPPGKNKGALNLSIGLLLAAIILCANNQIAVFDPSVSGYRFAPSLFSTLCLALWIKGKEQKHMFLFMIFVSLSTLWSFESAIFTLIPAISVWLANEFILFMNKNQKIEEVVHLLIRKNILIITFSCSLLSIAVVSLCYRLYLGFWPDWYAYIEVPKSYAVMGFGALPIKPLGSVLYLGVLFSLLSVYLSLMIKEKEYLFFVSSSALVSYQIVTTLYFINRSDDNNLLNLIPIFISTTAFIVFNYYSPNMSGAAKNLKILLLSTIVTLILIHTKDVQALKAQYYSPKTYFHNDAKTPLVMSWLELPKNSYIIDITWLDAVNGQTFLEFIDDTYKQWYPGVPWTVVENLELSHRDLYTDRTLSILKAKLLNKYPIFIINKYPSTDGREKLLFSIISDRLKINGLKLGEGVIIEERSRIVYPIVLDTP